MTLQPDGPSNAVTVLRAALIVGGMLLGGCDLLPVTPCDPEAADCGVVGLIITEPSEGTVGAVVPVVVSTNFASPDVEPQSEVQLLAGNDTVSLNRQGDGTYRGTWNPTVEGPVTLRAREAGGGIESDPVAVIVDLTAPVFAIDIPEPDRSQSSNFSDGDGLAWKRDERVTITFRSSADVVPGSVQYTLQTSIGEEFGPESAPLPVTATAADGGYVGQVELDLAEGEFNGLRGALLIRVTGRDGSGNPGSGTRPLPVTRVKWTRHFPLRGDQLGAVITEDGALWTAVRDGGVGALYRMEQDGGMESFDVSGLVGGLLVAKLPGENEQGLYFTANANSDAGFLRVAHADGGAVETVCGPYAAGMMSQLALLYGEVPLDNDQRTVVAGSFENVGTLVGAPLRTAPSECRPRSLPEPPSADGPWGAQKAVLYFQQDGFVTRATWGAGAWSGGVGFSNADLTTIAPDGDEVWASGTVNTDGGVFVLSPLDGTLLSAAESGTARARPLALDRDGRAYFGNGDGGLVQADRGGVIETAALDVTTAPVAGAGDLVYAIGETGRLAVFDTSLEELWAAPDAGSGASAMLLDCNRGTGGAPIAGRPGVLYVPSRSTVSAILVDSRGMAHDSPWPRHRHDNLNTASNSTPLSPCP